MIYTNRKVTVRNGVSTIDAPIILYRGDKEVDIKFEIIDIQFKFRGNNGNFIDNVKPSFGQLAIQNPDGHDTFTEISACEDGRVVFRITGEMIDEIHEVGFYSFHIRLYDDESSRITLPPVIGGIEIKEPLVIDSDDLVDDATVGYAMIRTKGEELDIFDEDGNYIPTEWVVGDRITAEKLNKIEIGITSVPSIEGLATEKYVDDAIESVDLPEEDKEKINVAYEHSQSDHLQPSDLDIYATIEYVNNKVDSNISAPYISTLTDTELLFESGTTLTINIDFVSPNPGYGTLKVAINDIDTDTIIIEQGTINIEITDKNFVKGSNKLSVYVIDRRGVMTNTLIFTVRYGSMEFTSTFNSNTSYDVGAPIRYYFTPSVLDTSKSLTFKIIIDNNEPDEIACQSDIRSVYTFSNSLSVGVHRCEAWITDGEIESIKHIFNLVIVDDETICVAPDVYEVENEEGSQTVINYRVYSKKYNAFKVYVYDGENVIFDGECGLALNQYRTSNLTEGVHEIRIKVSNEDDTKYAECVIIATISKSTFTILTPVMTGSMFIANAKDRTNADADKSKWIGKDQDGNEITAVLNGFTFDGNDGWLDNSVVCNGVGNIVIPISPLEDNARYGFTFDITFLTKKVGVQNAEVLSIWNKESDYGIKITTDEVILKSKKGNICDLYFPENEWVNAIFVIDRDQKMAKIYLNGVMCEAFALSDYSDNGVDYLEDFALSEQILINEFGGYCSIRSICVYNLALTTDEILNNFIATKQTKQEQQTLVDFQKGDHLPTMTIYCDFSGLGKDDKKPCNIIYNSPNTALYGESFALMGKTSLLQYQGTSSMAYPIKNYRINLVDKNGIKWKYNPFSSGQPESRFCLKADFMSSGHWQNTGLAKWVNDNLYQYDLNDEKTMNPSKWYDYHNDIPNTAHRETINGFPCRLILINDGNTTLNEGQNEPTPGNTKDMGIFNFNNDKDNTDTLGFDTDIFPYCASYEVTANSDTSAGAFMRYTGEDMSKEAEYYMESFELRFPDSDDVGSDYGVLSVNGDTSRGLKRLIEWVDTCTDDEFVQDFESYFNKQYTLRYYLLVITLGMVDNLGKNMMLDTFDHQIWYPRFYDMDTICSYDNTGQIKFDVDIEMEQGYWNTSSSRLWTRIRDLMHDDLVEIYKAMRANGMSYESFMSYFYDQQIAQIPQKYYNMDADVKYLPFADAYIGKAHGDGYEHLKRWLKNRLIFTDTLFDYQPSYINDVLTIRANTTDKMTLEIETYTPVYQHLSWYNGQMDKKKIDGKTSIIFEGFAQAATDQEILIYGGTNVKSIKGISSCNPSQLLIGSATRLTELDSNNSPILTDINSDNANLLPHIYLNNLNLSDCVSLSGILKINNSPLIKNVDISNTQLTELQLPSTLRNLEELKLSDHIRKLDIKNAELLTVLGIPSTIEYLSLINMPKLSSITNSSNNFNNLTTLIMENTIINPISNVISKAPNLQYVRLIGLSINCSSSQVQSLLNMKGVDSFGNEIPIGQAVSGKITLSQCSESMERQFKEEFPLVEFIVNSYTKSYTVTFVDGDGNQLYVTQVLENGEAVYVGGIPTKTPTPQYNFEYNGWDRQLKPILSDCTITATFESILRYYTIKFINSDTLEVVSEQVLGYGSTPIIPDVPEGFNAWKPMSIDIVTCDFEYYTQYIPYPEDLSIFEFTYSTSMNVPDKGYAEGYTVALKPNTEMPSYIIFPFEYEGVPVYRIKGNSSYSSNYQGKIKDVYIPETISSLGDYAFKCFGCSKLIFSKNVRWIGTSQYNIAEGCFTFCAAEEIVLPGVQILYSYNGAATYGGAFSKSNATYITLGSPEYPFNKWSENSTTSRQNFYDAAVTSNGGYINLVTKNGVFEDIDTSRGKLNCMIITKTPIERYSENGIDYWIIDDKCSVNSYRGSETEIEIPTTIKDTVRVTDLNNNLFTDNTSITKIVANSILNVGATCFCRCTNLTSVELHSATSLGASCFYNCINLTSIEIPSVISLDSSCFYSCNKLSSIEIPSATSLGANCFYNCSVLTSIDMPLVTSVGTDCFYGCGSLATVVAPQLHTSSSGSFAYCRSLKEINLPSFTTHGGNNMYALFKDCTSLESVYLGCLTTAKSIFSNNTNIKLVVVGKIGNPILSDEGFPSNMFSTNNSITLKIYVEDVNNPPTFTKLPWGATNATITYEQA